MCDVKLERMWCVHLHTGLDIWWPQNKPTKTIFFIPSQFALVVLDSDTRVSSDCAFHSHNPCSLCRLGVKCWGERSPAGSFNTIFLCFFWQEVSRVRWEENRRQALSLCLSVRVCANILKEWIVFLALKKKSYLQSLKLKFFFFFFRTIRYELQMRFVSETSLLIMDHFWSCFSWKLGEWTL